MVLSFVGNPKKRFRRADTRGNDQIFIQLRLHGMLPAGIKWRRNVSHSLRGGSYEEKCESNCMCNGSSNSNYCNPDGICAGSRRESDRKLLALNGR